MHHSHFFRLVAFVVCFVLIAALIPVANSVSDSGQDPLVNYGLTRSKDGQYIPVFKETDTKSNKVAILNPGELCALDSATFTGRYYWYRVIFFNEDGNAQAGYLREINFEQLTVNTLAAQMLEPDKAEKIARFIALADDPVLFPGHTETSAATSGTTNEQRRQYVLNTNTHKFHYPSCGSVKQMKPKNRKDYTGTRTEIINMGYVPCKNCNP